MYNILHMANELKVLKRYSPVFLLYCLLSMGFLAIGVAIWFLPLMTLTYTESGTLVKAIITGKEFLTSFYQRVNTGVNTDMGEQFITFLTNQRGVSVVNPLHAIIVSNKNSIMIAFASLLALYVTMSSLTAVFALVYILVGKGKVGPIKVFTKIASFILVALVVLAFAFQYLYGDFINWLAQNNAEIKDVSFAPFINPLIILASAIILRVTLNLIYKFGIKGRV